MVPGHLPAVRPQYAQPASVPNPYADSISRSTYPTTNAIPVSSNPNSAAQPGSPVDPLLAAAAEHERVGNSWQAINSYRQALQMDPRNRRALLSYGRMKHRARDFEGAIMLYQQLLQYYPQDAVALNDLGLCYARMGDTSQAVAILQQAIQQQPDSKRYRNNLAVVLVEAGRHDEALQTLIPVHGPPVANYNVAWLLARLGQNEEAVRFLNATLLADPSFTAAVELLTQVDPSSTQVASLPATASTQVATGGHPVSIYQSAPSPETPPQIQLRSGILPDTEQAIVTAAVHQEPLGELPPDLDDYQIPGLDDQD
jgi:predicted Zn-dependent protease